MCRYKSTVRNTTDIKNNSILFNMLTDALTVQNNNWNTITFGTKI